MRNYKPLLVHFENHASDPNNRDACAAMKGRAKLIMTSLKQYSTLLFIHLMLDLLQDLKHLSLSFQKDGLTVRVVRDGLQTSCMASVAMQVRNNVFLQIYTETHPYLPLCKAILNTLKGTIIIIIIMSCMIYLCFLVMKLFVHVQCRQTQAQGCSGSWLRLGLDPSGKVLTSTGQAQMMKTSTTASSASPTGSVSLFRSVSGV